ncbi:MAG TPA: hypothetical protein VGQ99_22870 [Tepidisphaeraceae bacterium]|nr:hypothetical protein [Tepidisphaeraceae bacterium]
MHLNGKSILIRRAQDKLRRRVRQLVGRPDNSPWVFDPRPAKRTADVDFAFALDYSSPNSRLMRLMHEAMSAYGLSCQLVNNTNVEKLLEEVEAGHFRPRVYLDLSSRPDDPFEKLLYAAHRAGAHTLRNPEHTKWVLKSQSHPQLLAAGLPLPPTVILKSGEPDRDLTAKERAAIGERAVIKPSFGEAARGCVVGIEPTRQNIATARDYQRKFDWLIQKMMTWTRLGDRPAYLRAYNVCGHRTLMWWAQENSIRAYDVLSWDDLRKYDLMGAVDIIDRLADVTGMDFFSTEIAITSQSGPDRFVLIDYVNDQCDMDPTDSPYSPPEPFCRFMCRRLAEFTHRMKQGLPPPDYRGLFLFDDSLEPAAAGPA